MEDKTKPGGVVHALQLKGDASSCFYVFLFKIWWQGLLQEKTNVCKHVASVQLGISYCSDKNSNAMHAVGHNLHGNSAMINRNEMERPMSY